MLKKYLLINQSLEKNLNSSQFSQKISPRSFIKNVIDIYWYSSEMNFNRLFRYIKYIFVISLVALSIFSLYISLNSPHIKLIREYTKNCTIMKQPECPKEFDYEKWASLEIDYKQQAHNKWVFWTNIITIVFFIVIFPYSVIRTYKFYRGWDIPLISAIWRIIKLLLISQLPSLTWWLGAFLGSLYNFMYSSLVTVPYELFGTYNIPWVL